MKHNVFVVIALALFVAMFAGYLVSCGGGGGGGGGKGPGPAALATGTFTKNVFYAGGISAEDQFSQSAGSRYQSLYLARDIKGAGKITSISYKYFDNNVVTPVSCPSVTIKMGHTQVNTLGATFASNVNNGRGSVQTVISNAPVTIPAGSTGSYYTINLAEPFYYNGVDNLVVEVSRAAACTSEVGTVANVSSPSYNAILRSNASSTATTGTTNNVVLDTVFTFSGGDNLVDYGIAGLSNAPFTSDASMQHVQSLYTAADISGSGPITGIGMVVGGVTTTSTYTVTVKLGHSILSTLTTTYAANFSDGPVTVANALAFAFPPGVPAGSIVWLPFTGSFSYNGSDNLLVDIDVSGGTAVQPWVATRAATGISLVGTSGSYSGAPSAAALHTKFRFNGGMMDVIGENNGWYVHFGSGPGGHQLLLHASELGTAGSITKLACRLYSQSSATTYQNVTVTLAHTIQSALSATDAVNIAGGTKVYDGPYSMQDGLMAGDWLEIPFTTSFSYDGTSNLVVQTTSSGGSIRPQCQLSGGAPRFQDRFKFLGGVSQDARGNFRFWINK